MPVHQKALTLFLHILQVAGHSHCRDKSGQLSEPVLRLLPGLEAGRGNGRRTTPGSQPSEPTLIQVRDTRHRDDMQYAGE
jgi:hypothetical protein